MNRDLKSISYAFILNSFNVYVSETEKCFIVEMLRCKKCSSYWPTALDQCYLCGEIKYYIYTCYKCGEMYSITGSKQKCKKCNESTLSMACINEECPSNTVETIKNAFKRTRGVFNKKSSWKISLSHCKICGNRSNGYYFHRVFVFNSQLENDDIKKYLTNNRLQQGDILIYKTKKQNTIFYDFLKINDGTEPLTFKPLFKENNLTKIIKNL